MFILTAHHLLQSAIGSPMPVLLGIESELSSDGLNITYHLTHGTVEVGAYGDVQLRPRSKVAFAAQYSHFDVAYAEILGNSSASYRDGNDTSSTMWMRSYDHAKKVTSITRPIYDPYTCFGYITMNNGTNDLQLAPETTGFVNCMTPSPPNQSCKFSSIELLLDHGVVNSRTVNGHAAFAVADVSCTSAVNVRFVMPTGLDYVALQPHGRSVLQVNGQALGSTMYMSSGMTPIVVSDQIEGVTEAGWFSGSAILGIEIM